MAVKKPLVHDGAGNEMELLATDTVELIYTSAGLLTTPLKLWVGTDVPTVAMGHSINMATAGFSAVPRSVQVIAMRNTTDVTQTVNVTIRSVTATAIVVNLTQNMNGTLTTVIVPATNLTGITLWVHVMGA